MNDGTVGGTWAGAVLMTQGDRVRYAYTSELFPPSENCVLIDVTTGDRVIAERLSAASIKESRPAR